MLLVCLAIVSIVFCALWVSGFNSSDEPVEFEGGFHPSKGFAQMNHTWTSCVALANESVLGTKSQRRLVKDFTSMAQTASSASSNVTMFYQDALDVYATLKKAAGWPSLWDFKMAAFPQDRLAAIMAQKLPLRRLVDLACDTSDTYRLLVRQTAAPLDLWIADGLNTTVKLNNQTRNRWLAYLKPKLGDFDTLKLQEEAWLQIGRCHLQGHTKGAVTVHWLDASAIHLQRIHDHLSDYWFMDLSRPTCEPSPGAEDLGQFRTLLTQAVPVLTRPQVDSQLAMKEMLQVVRELWYARRANVG